MRLTTLLPQLAGLQVEQLPVAADVITVRASGRGEAACCPVCGEPSRRVQSRYQRTVADRPVGGRRLSLVLRVRRFVCHNGACPRRSFAERFPQLVEPYARRTTRHQADLRELGLALGGRAGARLAARLGLAVSHDTVLRLAAGAPAPALAAPRVIGIDDVAFRRRLTSGTLVVDLERHRPIDVLPDRATDPVARWLTAHPSVEVVVRDRDEAYAAAVAQGAPQARQVVDRFHLLLNLGEAVERFLFTKMAVWHQIRWGDEGREGGTPTAAPHPAEPLPPWRRRLAEISHHRQQKRIEHDRRIHDLHARGVYVKDIARTLGVGRRTVYRSLHLPEPPPVKQPTIVRERRGERLDAWIADATQAEVKHLRRFALGLQDDPAVRAGHSEAWSNGQTEGQVNRLKLLKRQSDGRAGFALLRRRVFAAA